MPPTSHPPTRSPHHSTLTPSRRSATRRSLSSGLRAPKICCSARWPSTAAMPLRTICSVVVSWRSTKHAMRIKVMRSINVFSLTILDTVLTFLCCLSLLGLCALWHDSVSTSRVSRCRQRDVLVLDWRIVQWAETTARCVGCVLSRHCVGRHSHRSIAVVFILLLLLLSLCASAHQPGVGLLWCV